MLGARRCARGGGGSVAARCLSPPTPTTFSFFFSPRVGLLVRLHGQGSEMAHCTALSVARCPRWICFHSFMRASSRRSSRRRTMAPTAHHWAQNSRRGARSGCCQANAALLTSRRQPKHWPAVLHGAEALWKDATAERAAFFCGPARGLCARTRRPAKLLGIKISQPDATRSARWRREREHGAWGMGAVAATHPLIGHLAGAVPPTQRCNCPARRSVVRRRGRRGEYHLPVPCWR